MTNLSEQSLTDELVSALDKCRAIIKFHVQPSRCVTLADDTVVSARDAYESAVTALAKAKKAMTHSISSTPATIDRHDGDNRSGCTTCWDMSCEGCGPATTDEVERFYIDCEFDGHGGPLLSIAMVRQDGYGMHVSTTADAHDPWVIKNVLPLMSQHKAELHAMVQPNEVGHWLRAFLSETPRPVIVADSPVDIGRFCQALSTDTDGGWCSTGYPQITFEVHNVDCYPTDLEGAVQHNAYWDAMALRHRLAALASAPAIDEVVKAYRRALETTDAYNVTAINFRSGKACYAELNSAALAKEDARKDLAALNQGDSSDAS